MHSWTDINFQLTDTDRPLVTAIPKQQRVLLHLAGCLEGHNGRGFTLCLSPAHIPVIEKLLAELHAVNQVSLPQPAEELDSVELIPF